MRFFYTSVIEDPRLVLGDLHVKLWNLDRGVVKRMPNSIGQDELKLDISVKMNIRPILWVLFLVSSLNMERNANHSLFHLIAFQPLDLGLISWFLRDFEIHPFNDRWMLMVL